MTLKNIFINLLLLFAIGVCSWLLFFSTNRTLLTANQTDPNQIDASMENVIATVFDKQGVPSLKISTPKMVHYLKSDVSLITTPKITIFRELNNVWYIDAKYAKTIHGLDKITFHDNVVVRHTEDPLRPLTSMYTSVLTVYPKTKMAETSEAISILQPAAKINAIGMLANLNDGTVKLLSQAKEEYVPEV